MSSILNSTVGYLNSSIRRLFSSSKAIEKETPLPNNDNVDDTIETPTRVTPIDGNVEASTATNNIGDTVINNEDDIDNRNNDQSSDKIVQNDMNNYNIDYSANAKQMIHYNNEFGAAFEQLVRSLKHYESRKGFGATQYEKWRKTYPVYANMLDKHGFNLNCLGIFMYTQLTRAENRMWYDYLVDMNVKRTARSEWFIQLSELVIQYANNKPEFMNGSLPYEMNIESIPGTSKMASMCDLYNSIASKKTFNSNTLHTDGVKTGMTLSKSTPGHVNNKRKPDGIVIPVVKNEPLAINAKRDIALNNCLIQNPGSITCVDSESSSSDAESSTSSSDSIGSESSSQSDDINKLSGRMVAKRRDMHEKNKSARKESSDDDSQSENDDKYSLRRSKSKRSHKSSYEKDKLIISALQSLQGGSYVPAIDALKSSKQDVVDWFKHFEMVSSSARWDDETKALKLPLYLKGEAAHQWRALAKHKNDYQYVKRKLLKKLVAEDSELSAVLQFANMSQKCDESVEDFSRRLRKTVKKTNMVYKEKVLIDKFLRGVNSDVKNAIVAIPHKDLKQATKLAAKVEATRKDETETIISSISKPNDRKDLKQVKFGDYQQTSRNDGDLTKDEPNNRSPVICYYCNAPGHYRNECKDYIKYKGQSKCKLCGNSSHSGPCKKNY